jgi:lysophospholipase L1-like esterase
MRRPDFEQDIGRTLSLIEAAGIPVFLLGPPLEFPAPLAAALLKAEQTHLPMIRPINESFDDDIRLRQIVSKYPNVHFASVLDLLCEQSNCSLKADPETSIVWDTLHLTPEGSDYVVKRLKPALDSFLDKLVPLRGAPPAGLVDSFTPAANAVR